MPERLIIEARVNEYATREDNRHVHWTPEEIATDASECREAGAAAVHFHPRTSRGEPDLTYGTYRDIMERIRSTSDVLLQPTLGAAAQATDPQVRIANLQRLVADGLRPDLAPMDMGSSNVDLLDRVGGEFTTDERVYVNSTATLRYFAGVMKELGVKPYLHLWNVVQLRLAAAFARSGVLDGPLWAGFCLSGDVAPFYHPATRAGLRAYVESVPDDCPVVWSVDAFQADLLELAPEIIASGGHIAIGLGDYAYGELGQPRNADVVSCIAKLAADQGREVASPSEARTILSMGGE